VTRKELISDLWTYIDDLNKIVEAVCKDKNCDPIDFAQDIGDVGHRLGRLEQDLGGNDE
jgi:hypothetical protein